MKSKKVKMPSSEIAFVVDAVAVVAVAAVVLSTFLSKKLLSKSVESSFAVADVGKFAAEGSL